jgi:ketosteroid isomerase-like protein
MEDVMKNAGVSKFFIPIVAMSIGMVLPVAAQQPGQRPQTYNQDMAKATDQDSLRTAATNLNAQRGELFRKKDLTGLTALYLPDATYIQLLPRVQVMQGRAEIRQHLQEIMAASATDLVPTVTTARMGGNGAMMVSGDYVLVVQGGRKIYGHFFQELRQDGGTWKIATHAFARPEPVTAREAREYNVSG